MDNKFYENFNKFILGLAILFGISAFGGAVFLLLYTLAQISSWLIVALVVFCIVAWIVGNELWGKL